jgi:peroxiredoxin
MRTSVLLFLLTFPLFPAGDMVGRRAPGFSLPDGTFHYHDPQDYLGKILIVEFMQTSCPHCAAFSKILEEAAAKYAGKLSVISIVNPPDTPDKVKQFAAAYKISTPILFDTGQVALSYVHWMPGKPTGFDLPRVFLIDAGGIIRRDLEYNVLTKPIFEGRGLFAEIDKLLQLKAAPAGKQK